MQQGQGLTPSQGQTMRAQMLSTDITLQARSQGAQEPRSRARHGCQEDALVGSEVQG